MKARLMFPDRDFDPEAKPPANADDLVQDLEMQTIFAAMADGDAFLDKIARGALLSGMTNGRTTVLWRQAVLRDCIEHEETIRELYEIALAPLQARKSLYFGFGSRHPGLLLSDGRRLLEALRGILGRLFDFASRERDRFQSKALRELCVMLIRELDPEYLVEIDRHLTILQFRHGVLFSGKLGPANEGQDYVLRYFAPERWIWLKELIGGAPPHYRFTIHPRDESGARALSALNDTVLADVARTTAQAGDHVNEFFAMLRAELAFYIGCLNLRRQLSMRRVPTTVPVLAEAACTLVFSDMRDASLALINEGEVVGNALDAREVPLIIVTGANQGGKSTFLRSLGLAQMMLQAGMFVTAQRFEADLRDGVFTHYRRREDRGLNSGKFDEELRRMSGLADHAGEAPFFLFNESFAATNEREGSEVARQIVTALTESGARVVFVTHMHAFAEAFVGTPAIPTRFLRAEREEDGRRSFRILPGDALTTSFGRDLYRQIFGEESEMVEGEEGTVQSSGVRAPPVLLRAS